MSNEFYLFSQRGRGNGRRGGAPGRGGGPPGGPGRLDGGRVPTGQPSGNGESGVPSQPAKPQGWDMAGGNLSKNISIFSIWFLGFKTFASM